MSNDTSEWSQLWRTGEYVRYKRIEGADVEGGWRLYAPGEGDTARAIDALPLEEDERFIARVVSALRTQNYNASGTENGTGIATGIAVVDREDVYLSLVIGDASGTVGTLTPAILVEKDVCGRRFVLAAGDRLSLLQVSSRLRRSSLRLAVESYRLVECCGTISVEGETRSERRSVPDIGSHPTSTKCPCAESAPAAARDLLPRRATIVRAGEAAVNVVSQTGDQLRAHADSRGHGVASRF